MSAMPTLAPHYACPTRKPCVPHNDTTPSEVTTPASDLNSLPTTPCDPILCPSTVPPALSTSTATTPASPFADATPSLLPPLPSAPPSLTTLPHDLLRRIISHLLHDAHRGTPYYPPKLALDVLPLAETCSLLRALVARHLYTDHFWLHALDFSSDFSRRRARTLAWYRLVGPNLRSLSLTSRLLNTAALRTDVVSTVSTIRPALRSLDLSGLDPPEHGPCTDALRAMLDAARPTLHTLCLDVAASPVVDAVCEANLYAVSHLEVRQGPNADGLRLLAVLHSIRSRHQDRPESTSSLTTLVLKTSDLLPQELLPEAVAAAAPALTALHFQELGALRDDSAALSAGFSRLAVAFPKLRDLRFQDGTVQVDALRPFWDLARFSCLSEVSLVNCKVLGSLGSLCPEEISGRMLRRLQLIDSLSSDDLAHLGRSCKHVVDFGLRLHRDSIGWLENTVGQMKWLESLSLVVHPGGGSSREDKREICQAGIVAALTAAGPRLKKFVVHGESLSVPKLTMVFMQLGKQLEFVVTGIFAPRKSRTKCIIKLLRVVQVYCTEMRILCFGLDLPYDPRAMELNVELLLAIEETKNQVPNLDPVWLERNASSLLTMPKPTGFERFDDYESDDSFTGVDMDPL